MPTDLIELGRKKKYPKWNKAKYSGNQQWQEGNQDSKQRFGTKGRNKHTTGTEWRTRIQKKMKRVLQTPGTTWNVPIRIIGAPEGEEQHQEVKEHSSRPVGGVETGSQVERTVWARRGWLTGKLKIKKTSGYKVLWVLQRWEKLPVSQERSLESGARGGQVSSIVPPQNPPPTQCSKEGCPTLENT